MEIRQMPGCCSAKLIVGFGGTVITSVGSARQPNKGWLKHQLKQEIGYIKRDGNGLAVAYTNNQQTVANEVLQEMGFFNSGKVSKRKHPETQVIMWWLPLGAVEAIPDIPKPEGPKRDARGRFMKKEAN